MIAPSINAVEQSAPTVAPRIEAINPKPTYLANTPEGIDRILQMVITLATEISTGNPDADREMRDVADVCIDARGYVERARAILASPSPVTKDEAVKLATDLLSAAANFPVAQSTPIATPVRSVA